MEPAYFTTGSDTMKGFTVHIYKNDLFAGCSNGGISATCSQVTLIGPGVPELSEPTETAPAVVLHLSNRDYLSARPAEPQPGKCGPMMGGSFIYSSDARFSRLTGNRGAIPLHDRFESTEEYAKFSN